MHNFILRSGPALVFASAKLLKNWHNECFLFLDTENARLGLRIYVKHAQVKTDLKFSYSIDNQIWTDPSKTASPDVTQTLILSILLSYTNYILLFILSKKIVSLILSEKKRTITSTKITHQKARKQVFHDKFHKEKSLETHGMSLCQNIRKTSFMCIV